MSRIFILILLFPMLAYGQPSRSIKSKPGLAKIYTQAIGDFIKAANKRNKTSFDTLYIANRKAGQADDFPDIDLAIKIENTHIVLIAPELGGKSQNERKERIYINLMGWVEKENAEFIFVVFSNGFKHQYDYTINYKYNKKRKMFDLEKIEFKGPPFKN